MLFVTLERKSALETNLIVNVLLILKHFCTILPSSLIISCILVSDLT